MQEKKVIQEGTAVLNEMNATLLEIEDLPLKKIVRAGMKQLEEVEIAPQLILNKIVTDCYREIIERRIHMTQESEMSLMKLGHISQQGGYNFSYGEWWGHRK